MNFIKKIILKIKLIYIYLDGFICCKKAKFYNVEEMVKKIEEEKISVIRIGDGEFNLIKGKDIHYQDYSIELGHRLNAIIENFISKNTNYLVCMPAYFFRINGLKLLRKREYLSSWILARKVFKEKYDYDIKYGDAFLFSQGNEEKYKKIWLKEKAVIFVHNSEIYAKKFKQKYNIEYHFVKVPSKNAFRRVSEIILDIEDCIKQVKNNKICILISAGPCAKVLVEELSTKGYWAIDTGHCWDEPLHEIPE